MAGRARGVTVSSSSVVLAKSSLERTALMFSVGDATNASSVVLKDEDDASLTNGFPLSATGGVFEVRGKAARHRWSAIRLAAVDCLVGVYEVYRDNYAADGDPTEGVPT